jgi:hypothetical protein
VEHLLPVGQRVREKIVTVLLEEGADELDVEIIDPPGNRNLLRRDLPIDEDCSVR